MALSKIAQRFEYTEKGEIVKARELLVNVDRVWNRNPSISSVIDAVSEQHGNTLDYKV